MSNAKQNDEKPPSASFAQEDDDPGEQIKHLNSATKMDNKSSLLRKAKGVVSSIFRINKSTTIEDEVAEIIEEHDPEGVQVGTEERSILHNVLSLGDSTVEDVMVPRTDIIAVDNKISLNDLRKIIIDKEHTRTPVYKDSLDNIIGFVHIKDLIPLFGQKKKFDINLVIREILFVPPSMKVADLLVKMRAKRVHMALVVDEYGGTDGLVTMEDLVEEIVGEIEDEHDEVEEDEIKAIDNNSWDVSARVSVKALEEKLGVDFQSNHDDNDFETIGGLIFFMLGHVPENGEKVTHPSGYIFKVTDADDRRVKKLLVSKSQ